MGLPPPPATAGARAHCVRHATRVDPEDPGFETLPFGVRFRHVVRPFCTCLSLCSRTAPNGRLLRCQWGFAWALDPPLQKYTQQQM